MSDLKLQNAQAAYSKLCSTMDSMDWHYTKKEDDLIIECGAKGEDLPMDLTIICKVELQLLTLISHLPFTVPEDKRLDMAMAVSVINNRLANGCFDYNILEGKLFFRMSTSFLGIALGAETIEYIIYCSCGTIDEYNDKLLMISKGLLSLEQFLKEEYKEA